MKRETRCSTSIPAQRASKIAPLAGGGGGGQVEEEIRVDQYGGVVHFFRDRTANMDDNSFY